MSDRIPNIPYEGEVLAVNKFTRNKKPVCRITLFQEHKGGAFPSLWIDDLRGNFTGVIVCENNVQHCLTALQVGWKALKQITNLYKHRDGLRVERVLDSRLSGRA